MSGSALRWQLRSLAGYNHGDHALWFLLPQVVLPHHIGVARVGHALHHPGGDATDDFPNGAQGHARDLFDQRHTTIVTNRRHDGCPRQAPVREIEHTARTSALDRNLVGVRQGVRLPDLDAVATTEEVVGHKTTEHHHDDSNCEDSSLSHSFFSLPRGLRG